MGTTSMPKKPKKPTGKTTQLPLHETTPNSEFQYPNTVAAMEKEIIKAIKIDKKSSTLLDLTGKYLVTSCICPNKNHHFFQCLSLKLICRENDWTSSLDQAPKKYKKINGQLLQQNNNNWQFQFFGKGWKEQQQKEQKAKSTQEPTAAAASAK